jgi:hypothetical protein
MNPEKKKSAFWPFPCRRFVAATPFLFVTYQIDDYVVDAVDARQIIPFRASARELLSNGFTSVLVSLFIIWHNNRVALGLAKKENLTV